MNKAATISLALVAAMAGTLLMPGEMVRAASLARGAHSGATVPVTLELNRPYTELRLAGPSGKKFRARFWLDTGGGAIILSGPLARRLGLKASGKAFSAEGQRLVATTLPSVRLAGMPLRLTGVNAYMVLGTRPTLEHTDAQGALPLRALRNYEVVLNYAADTFTVADPGTLKHEGAEIPAHFSRDGFIAVTAIVAGHRYGFLLDTGGQYCMVSRAVLAQWARAHPDWPRAAGAFGPADMMLGDGEARFRMLRLGALRLGRYSVQGVGVVSRPVGNYERMMSRLTGTPVIGSIGGNLLRSFRLDIDYPGGRVYLRRAISRKARTLDMVGITVEPAGAGYVVANVLPGEAGLRKGDRLIRVGGLRVSGMTPARLMAALSGPVGATRHLIVERHARQISVVATVIRIL